MQTQSVDPRLIRVPDVRVTARMSEETAEQFRCSVEGVGIDEPIKAYQVGDDLWLSDGLHRLQQALRLKLPTVEVIVRPGTMVDVMCNNLMSGHLRGKHPVSEMRRVIEELYKVHQVGIEEIVKRTGLTQRHVENLLLLSELSPLCLEALDDEVLPVSHALELRRITDPVQQEVALGYTLTNHWRRETLREYVRVYNSALQETAGVQAPTGPPPPVRIPCAYCGDEHDLHELASVITCRSCQGVLLQAIAEARRELAAQAPPTAPALKID
jgi:ParB-like chromosome segregation protein Spo0J